MRQVRESEPPRPSTNRPGLDRDLETVVLKCLEKEPSRRYSSADALADDLDAVAQWRADPGAAGRSGRAALVRCRRNPAVSGLTAAVAASLLIGIIAFDILRGASVATSTCGAARARAGDQGGEKTWRVSLPAAWRVPSARSPTRYSRIPEVRALWELAAMGTDSVRLEFLNEATRGPITLTQLCARSEPALIAAVGLDPARASGRHAC